MPHIHEQKAIAKIAELLGGLLNTSCCAKEVNGRRFSIRCYYRGLRILIEPSYDKDEAERRAVEELKQGLADVVIALWIKNQFEDVPEAELRKLIKSSRYDAKIFALGETKGLFKDVDLPGLARLLDGVMSYLADEKEVLEGVKEVKRAVNNFVRASRSIEEDEEMAERTVSLLHELYGFSATGFEDFEIMMGQVALSIILSTVFYEHVRSAHQLDSVMNYVEEDGSIAGLRKALERLREIGRGEAVELSLKALSVLPPSLAAHVKLLIKIAVKISQKPQFLVRDFAGRIYHEITGDIALRKGLATYYTEIPAAHLLANLAIRELFDLGPRYPAEVSNKKALEMIERIKAIKIIDLACGSGTLLTAVYHNLTNFLVRALCFCSGIRYPKDLEKQIIEEGIFGLDALRYATQIARINLALTGPEGVAKQNIHATCFGDTPRSSVEETWLGSLELLNDASITGERSLKIPNAFDLIIMNPPFTRATGRVGKAFTGKRRGIFGFMAYEELRRSFLKKYDRVRKNVREDLREMATTFLRSEKLVPSDLRETFLKTMSRGRTGLEQYFNIGQAGEGLLFLYLAYKYVPPNGIIAFVLPRSILAGASWFLARLLLASKFHLRYVVVSSDVKNGYNFSEGASLSEVLLIAKRVDQHDEDEGTFFVNLLRKPKTVLEALMLADEVARVKCGSVEVREGGMLKNVSEIVSAVIKEVKRTELLKFVDNWNRFVALKEVDLLNGILELIGREG